MSFADMAQHLLDSDDWLLDALRSGVSRYMTGRAKCVHCSLATNQEPFRARFMSTTLGYSELFDREFYSCRMGVSKPSVEYFRTMLTELGVEPPRVLFIDDHQVNVAAARETGIQAVAFAPEPGRPHSWRSFGASGWMSFDSARSRRTAGALLCRRG